MRSETSMESAARTCERRALTLAAIVIVAGMASASAPQDDRSPAARPTLADLAFLAGRWQAEWQGDILEEHFSAPEDGSMIGMFRWRTGGGTRFTEHMVAEERDDGCHFLLRYFHPGAIPWEQERDGPLHMRLTSCAESRAIFTSERDFPRTITYHRTQPETMVVRLEGRTETGDDREMEFAFRSMSMATTMTTATHALTDAGRALGYDGGLTISLPVSDLDRSIDFYERVVGFKVQYKLDDMGWCELTTSVPQVNLGLNQVETPNPGGQTPVFGVKDIAATRATLEKRGAKFDGPTVEIPGMVRLATFFDPDGNPLKLYQSLAGAAP